MKDTTKAAIVVIWIVLVLVFGATAEDRRQATLGTPDAALPGGDPRSAH